MKIYNSISNFQNVCRPILTTGTFDGVHLGHQIIIDRLKEIAKNQNGETVLLTFFPHPRMVLFPKDHNLKLINTMEEKKILLEEAGIDHLIIHPFTNEFSRTSSMKFVRDIIVNEINAHKLVIGYNHHFGRNREGTFKHLKKYAHVYGFDVEEIPAHIIDNVNISSTKIRQALLLGNVSIAANYLGYNYSLKEKLSMVRKLAEQLVFLQQILRLSTKVNLFPKMEFMLFMYR